MFQTSFNLRRLASKKGPSEEDFTKLANSVDKFSTCLLDPLKSQIEARHAFGDSIDDVMDAAINLEQKEVNISAVCLFTMCFAFLSVSLFYLCFIIRACS